MVGPSRFEKVQILRIQDESLAIFPENKMAVFAVARVWLAMASPTASGVPSLDALGSNWVDPTVEVSASAKLG